MNIRAGNDCPPAAHLGDGDDCSNLDVDYELLYSDNCAEDGVVSPKDTVAKATDPAINLINI